MIDMAFQLSEEGLGTFDLVFDVLQQCDGDLMKAKKILLNV